ncbi:MAG: DNA-binding response regulator [Okeania sp. SIO3C4]|nr:DNA-binding response regulator [Okeania sp. SIO3C4]
MASKKDEVFAEAAKYWDLERLYKALATVKRRISPGSRKGLTDTEKLYLRGILCGHSPAEIAKKLYRSPKGVEVYVCKTLYQYLKQLVDTSSEQMGNWRNIHTWLEDAGYKTLSSVESKLNYNCLPSEALVKIVNMGFENSNTLNIDINIKLSFPSDSETEVAEDLEE